MKDQLLEPLQLLNTLTAGQQLYFESKVAKIKINWKY